MGQFIAVKTIVITKPAAKDLDALDSKDGEAITAALAAYAVSGRGDVRVLVGREAFRLRIGRYRVIFTEDEANIHVDYIGKRDTTTYRRH